MTTQNLYETILRGFITGGNIFTTGRMHSKWSSDIHLPFSKKKSFCIVYSAKITLCVPSFFSSYLRNKIFLSLFYRAIKHGSELRCLEIQITRQKQSDLISSISTTTHVLLHNKTQVGIFYFDSNTFFFKWKGRFVTKIRGVSSDVHDVITA